MGASPPPARYMRQNSAPSSRGIPRSIRIRLCAPARAALSASRPSATAVTSYPSSSSVATMISRIAGSSSATRIRGVPGRTSVSIAVLDATRVIRGETRPTGDAPAALWAPLPTGRPNASFGPAPTVARWSARCRRLVYTRPCRRPTDDGFAPSQALSLLSCQMNCRPVNRHRQIFHGSRGSSMLSSARPARYITSILER